MFHLCNTEPQADEEREEDERHTDRNGLLSGMKRT